MKLFTVKLTDEERAKLEAHRVALGLRAQTDVIRRWIAQPRAGPSWRLLKPGTPEHAAALAQPAPEMTEEERRALLDYPAPNLSEETKQRLIRASQEPSKKTSKPKPFKSRLKGEWKAP